MILRTLITSFIAATLFAVINVPSAKCAEPGLAPTSAVSQITRQVTLNDQITEVPVEAISNPLVLVQTTMGDIVLELFPLEAPQNVANFIGWADGTKSIPDTNTNSEIPRPYYEGLKFHRVISNFMIQTGAMDEHRVGPPGPLTKDEISAVSLGLDKMLVVDAAGIPNTVLGIRNQHDFQQRILKPLYQTMGISTPEQLTVRTPEIERSLKSLTVMKLYELAGYHYRNELQSHLPLRGSVIMANQGPDGNGSQFFINLVDTPWLAGKHTVIGKVRLGMDVIDAIGKVAVDADKHPVQEITMLGLRVL